MFPCRVSAHFSLSPPWGASSRKNWQRVSHCIEAAWGEVQDTESTCLTMTFVTWPWGAGGADGPKGKGKARRFLSEPLEFSNVWVPPAQVASDFSEGGEFMAR